jgi:hypothetical protein
MWFSLLATGCGGAAPQPKLEAVDTPTITTTATPGAGPAAEPAAAGEALLWAHLPQDPPSFLAVDVAGLTRSPFGSLVLALRAVASAKLDACKVSPFDSIRRVLIAFTSSDKPPTGIAVETTTPASDVLACLEKLAVDTVESVYWDKLLNPTRRPTQDPLAFVAAGPNLLLGAPKSQLAARMRMVNTHAPVLSETKLVYGFGNETAFGESSKIERAELAVDAKPDLTELSLRIATTIPAPPSSPLSGEMKVLSQALSMVGMPKHLAALFQVRETRPAREVLATFSVAGGDAAQRKQIGDVVAFGVQYVQDYISHKKAAEAQLQLRLLASNAQAAFNLVPSSSATPARKRSCGLAAPLTPAAAPRGVKYQSRAADWAAPGWAALKFSIDDLQYFAYGVERSADGQICTFYALGDLNGDGKTSRYSLEARVTKDAKGIPSLTVDRDLVEVNPLE